MEKDYSTYTATDFVTDIQFYTWVIIPTEELDIYWKDVLTKHPELTVKINRAICIINNTHFEKPVLSAERKSALKERIEAEIKLKKRRTLRIRLLWKAAACIAVIFTLSATVWNTFLNQQADFDYQQFAQVDITSFDGNETQLILNDSSKVELDKNDALKYGHNQIMILKDSAATTGQQVMGQESESRKNEIAFNKLVVPNGRTSSVEFHDGTKVWINSGSVVVYPVEFTGETREIYVEGEIYLEVARNEEKPFIVKTPDCDVRVLGTAFNVSSYKNEAVHSVVLVHGSVEVQNFAQNKRMKLVPNEKVDIAGGEMSKYAVDVRDYTSWKDGFLTFHDEPFTNVMARIARYYNVKIMYKQYNARLRCSGKLNLNEDLEKVIQSLEGTMSVSIQRSNNKLYISNKNL